MLALALAAVFAFSARHGHAEQKNPAIVRWWSGQHCTGDYWWGGRQFLEEHGLNLGGGAAAIYHGMSTSDSRDISVFCHYCFLTARFDFGKMLGLEGLTGQAGVQWQTGKDLNSRIGASSAFRPAAFTGYWKCHLRPIDLTYVTPEIFGIRDFLTISGGWQNPRNYFMVQPSASSFQNCAFGGGGLTANNIARGGSPLAWGGYVRIRPVTWSYVQAGCWGAGPEILNWKSNRGLYLLTRPFKHNGVFFIGEVGILTAALDHTLLPGKFVFGSHYRGLSNRSFAGAAYPGRFGFYWQIDQMLYREPVDLISSSYSLGPSMSVQRKSTSQQGLYFFGCINHAPKFNSVVPVFLRTGLVYKGLIPTRDEDDLGVAFAFGNYSYYNILARRLQGRGGLQRTNEAVWEIHYRFRANKWLHVQPFLEYLVRPSGDGHSRDTFVMGVAARLAF